METLAARGHREFPREIVGHVSVSLDELSRMTERKRSDFGGMLHKQAEMGLVEMHLRDGSRLGSRVVDGRDAIDAAPNEETCRSSVQSKATVRCCSVSQGGVEYCGRREPSIPPPLLRSGAAVSAGGS